MVAGRAAANAATARARNAACRLISRAAACTAPSGPTAQPTEGSAHAAFPPIWNDEPAGAPAPTVLVSASSPTVRSYVRTFKACKTKVQLRRGTQAKAGTGTCGAGR